MELKKYNANHTQVLKINQIVRTISETHKFDKDKLIAINTSDVENGVMGNGTLTFVDELKGQFKKTIVKDDILFSEIRPANRRFAKVTTKNTKDYVVSTKLMVLRKYNEDVDLEYFYYCLTNQPFLDILQRRAENRIGSFPQITFDLLSEYAFPIPPISEQKRISSVISTLDKKIALNRQINQNLEAMAKQLYDYWFVQFDFPNEEGKPYKSSGGEMVWNEKLKREIPIDWEVLSLFDAVSVQYGFPFATEQFTEEETNVPVVRIRDILEGTTSAYSLEKADEKYHLNENDVLVGMDGNFHMNFWHDNIAYLNQRCVRLRAHSDSTISSIQILHSIKPYIKAKEQNAKGSTVGHLSDKDLKGLYLIKPLKTRAFNPRKTLDGLLALVIENKKQILSLTKQRDELLPLLINGQITIE